ncbi:MAG: hypothetical protein ACQEP9_00635 [Bacillota bacterium]
MLKKKSYLLIIAIVILSTTTVNASNLSIGGQNYNLQLSSFSQGDIKLISIGYGQDKYSGFGAEIFSGSGGTGIELEYQFIPQSMQQQQEVFNYAAKLGAVSGDLWDSDSPGLKAGFVIERKLDQEREIYFDADMINSSGLIIDTELGFCGRLGKGVMGVLGYKLVAHEENMTNEGVHFGVKIDF